MTTNLLFALGLFDWLEVGAHLPVVVYQRGETSGPDGAASVGASAVGDVRTGLKGTILHAPDRGFGLGLAFDLTAPTGDPSRFAGENGLTYAPQVLLLQRMARGIEAAVNLGYLARPDRTVSGVVLGDAVTYRLATRVPFGPRRQIAAVAELDGSFGVRRGSDKPLVMRGGLRWRTRNGVVIGVYGGGAPVAGFGVPDVHGLLSVAYAPPHRVRGERAFEGAPRPSAAALARRHARVTASDATIEVAAPTSPDDPDGDTLVAGADRCPSVAEDIDGFEDDDGCPEHDNDRDGVRDDDDLCPLAPELVNGYADWDGCPDRKTAGGGESFATFDPRLVLPHIAFEARAPSFDDATASSLSELAETVRLNPWMGQLEIEIRVQSTGDEDRDRELAVVRGSAVREYLLERGLDPWRVQVVEPRSVPDGHPERVHLAIAGTVEGLRPIAPSATELARIAAGMPRPAPAVAEAPASSTDAAEPLPVDRVLPVMAQGPAE